MKRFYVKLFLILSFCHFCQADFFRITISADMSLYNSELNQALVNIKDITPIGQQERNLIITQLAVPIDPEWEGNLEFYKSEIEKRISTLVKLRIKTLLKKEPLVLSLNKIDYWPERGIVVALFDNTAPFFDLVQSICQRAKISINKETRPALNMVDMEGNIVSVVVPYIPLAKAIKSDIKICPIVKKS